MATSKFMKSHRLKANTFVPDTPKVDAVVLTAKQAAAVMQVSTKTVYRLVAIGKLKRLPFIRHLRIPKREIEEFAAQA